MKPKKIKEKEFFVTFSCVVGNRHYNGHGIYKFSFTEQGIFQLGAQIKAMKEADSDVIFLFFKEIEK